MFSVHAGASLGCGAPRKWRLLFWERAVLGAGKTVTPAEGPPHAGAPFCRLRSVDVGRKQPRRRGSNAGCDFGFLGIPPPFGPAKAQTAAGLQISGALTAARPSFRWPQAFSLTQCRSGASSSQSGLAIAPFIHGEMPTKAQQRETAQQYPHRTLPPVVPEPGAARGRGAPPPDPC